MSETRTIRMTIVPELAAYFGLLDQQPGRTFDADEYDLFAAGYRAAVADASDTPVHEARRRPEMDGVAYEPADQRHAEARG